MAHALHEYIGTCSNIHGHSYELHVSVIAGNDDDRYIPAPGIIFDFKDLKSIVRLAIIDNLDHRLVLSEEYIKMKITSPELVNIFTFEAEPSAENILVFIRHKLDQALPSSIKLAALKLYETKDSYAEWTNDDI